MEAVRHEAASRAPIYLEDLSGPLEVLLLCVYFIVFYFVRRRGLSVAVLAHALSMAFLVGTLGHYIEKHWLGLDGIRELLQPHEISMHFWTSLLMGGILLSTIAVQLHKDKMLEGEIAQPYRFVFFASTAILYSATGTRLNSLLGGSAINPAGGGYFLKVLKSPPMVAAILVTAGLSVWLYATLVRAEMEGQWEAIRHHHHQHYAAYPSSPVAPTPDAAEAYHRAAAAQQAQAAEIQQAQQQAAWQQQQLLEQQQLQQQQEAEAAAQQQQLLAWQAAQQQQQTILQQQLEWEQQQAAQQVAAAAAVQRQQVDWQHHHQHHQAASSQQLSAHHEAAPALPYRHTSSHAAGAYSGPIETMPMPTASSPYHRSASSSDIIMATKTPTPTSSSSSPYGSASSHSPSSSSQWESEDEEEDEEEEDGSSSVRGRMRLPERCVGGRGESGYGSNSDSGGSRQRRRPRRSQSEGRSGVGGSSRHHHHHARGRQHRQHKRQAATSISAEQQWEAWQAETQAAQQQWVECYDESHGRPYYFNQGTGETSWTKPWSYEAAAGSVFDADERLHTKHE